jgi:hypothetical protein
MEHLRVTSCDAQEPSYSQYAPSADGAPIECWDGSLVIDAEGRIVKATQEQQERAVQARRDRAATDASGSNDPLQGGTTPMRASFARRVEAKSPKLSED